ncbi:hypothetical protein ENUP19_0011G0023 [Entamoeba nuttalli]|uniref:Helicase superfamily 3 single-stranded DNA/RNA virus domain-containing protein n=1 Tax=Entamoeba nuttalli TaxID=412467 RepID=A0ABQ0D835_9EUKA
MSGRTFVCGEKNGTGKTFTANEVCKRVGQLIPYNKSTSKLWRNYKKQKVVLLDGIDKDSVKYIKSSIFTSQISSKEEDTIIINPVNYTLIITSKFNPEELFEIKNSYEVEKFHRLFEVVHTDENYLDFKNE